MIKKFGILIWVVYWLNEYKWSWNIVGFIQWWSKNYTLGKLFFQNLMRTNRPCKNSAKITEDGIYLKIWNDETLSFHIFESKYKWTYDYLYKYSIYLKDFNIYLTLIIIHPFC